jgi:hypothetical protein
MGRKRKSEVSIDAPKKSSKKNEKVQGNIVRNN